MSCGLDLPRPQTTDNRSKHYRSGVAGKEKYFVSCNRLGMEHQGQEERYERNTDSLHPLLRFAVSIHKPLANIRFEERSNVKVHIPTRDDDKIFGNTELLRYALPWHKR